MAKRMNLYAVAALATVAVLLVLGCGDSGSSSTGDGGQNNNTTGDGGLDCLPTASDCTDPGQCCSGQCEEGVCMGPVGPCLGIGAECLASSECCSGRCEEVASGLKVCVRGGCAGTGQACEMAVDCCSLGCVDGFCAEDLMCAVVGDSCAVDTDCCSDFCDTDTCGSSGSSCITLGELCSGDSSCCSGHCEDIGGQFRCTLVSFCLGGGELCNDNGDCCSGVCGQDGLCPVMEECQTAGEPCTGYHECCSGVCADPGTGVDVCMFVSGCRPIGEICLQDSDCCGNICDPFQETGVLRCVKPNEPGCLPEGEVCWMGMAANCCPPGSTGGQQLCLPTDIGITRCFGEGVPSDCIEDGMPCNFSDECCNGFCLLNELGELVCGDECVPLNGACMADADCCEGMVCVDGQCEPSGTDCVPIGGSCQTHDDCCNEWCDQNTGVCGVIIE